MVQWVFPVCKGAFTQNYLQWGLFAGPRAIAGLSAVIWAFRPSPPGSLRGVVTSSHIAVQHQTMDNPSRNVTGAWL